MTGHDEDAASEARGGTTSGEGTPYPVETGISRGAALTYALFLAGPLILSVHFFVVYLVGEMGCTADGPGLDVFDPPVPGLVAVVTTAVAALACLVAGVWSYRRGRREERSALSYPGSMLAGLGFLTVLFVGAPAVVLPACG